MTKIKASSRIVGGHRGGVGGGYEPLDPDFDLKRIRTIRDEYVSLDRQWQGTYLAGLSKADQFALERLIHPERI